MAHKGLRERPQLCRADSGSELPCHARRHEWRIMDGYCDAVTSREGIGEICATVDTRDSTSVDTLYVRWTVLHANASNHLEA